MIGSFHNFSGYMRNQMVNSGVKFDDLRVQFEDNKHAQTRNVELKTFKFFSTIVILFIMFLIPIKSYATVTIEEVIKNHNLDLSKDEDRCNLPFLIEHEYVDVFNGEQVEYYDVIVGDYSKNNDLGITFRVFLDKKRHVRTASFADSDRFYILKLKNGQLIGSHDGYFVPFDEFGFGGKNFKLNGRFAVLQKTPPKDKIKYFYVNECKVQIFNNNS